jgi:hypothetical protein
MDVFVQDPLRVVFERDHGFRVAPLCLGEIQDEGKTTCKARFFSSSRREQGPSMLWYALLSVLLSN